MNDAPTFMDVFALGATLTFALIVIVAGMVWAITSAIEAIARMRRRGRE